MVRSESRSRSRESEYVSRLDDLKNTCNPILSKTYQNCGGSTKMPDMGSATGPCSDFDLMTLGRSPFKARAVSLVVGPCKDKKTARWYY